MARHFLSITMKFSRFGLENSVAVSRDAPMNFAARFGQ
jgi:hypothetical protein